jgi:hypothetical protein
VPKNKERLVTPSIGHFSCLFLQATDSPFPFKLSDFDAYYLPQPIS